MTTEPGGRPQGRRHNGLVAPSFTSVGDVDPRVGEHLLDLLYLSGIAAYLQPTVDYDAVTRAASLPRQPTDRLWVDRRRFGEARDLVAAEAAASGRTSVPPAAPPPRSSSGPVPVDQDAAWAEIVAFFDQELTTAVPPWPVNEDTDEAAAGPPARANPAAEWPGTPEPEVAEPEEEGYDRPAPPPLPRISKGTAGAVAAIAFGLFMLLAPGALNLDPNVGLTVGVLSVVGGIAFLIWHMHDGPPAEDRPDDGAVV